MSRWVLVLRHEVYALVSRRSFWLFLLGMPLLAAVIYGGAALLSRPQGGATSPGSSPFPLNDGSPAPRAPLDSAAELFAPDKELRPQGWIDRAGLLADAEPLLHDERDWIRYDPTAQGEAQAKADLRSGEIGGYFIIPQDYIENGRMLAFTAEYNLPATQRVAAVLVEVIEANLLEDAAQPYWRPFTEIVEVDLSPSPTRRRDNLSPMGMMVPFGVTSLLMITILGTASMLLNGLAEEKVNRTIEALLLSISPRELLIGKIAGMGLVGLLQTAVWGGMGFLLLRLSGRDFAVPEENMLSAPVMAWGVVFFVLGYLLYAALMAGVGALVPGLREASQISTVIMLPLMAPYFVLPVLLTAPDTWLVVALSLFPLTAPTGMIMRLSAVDVPLWQVLVSALLLAVSSLLVMRLAARMFHAQSILAGSKFSLKNLWRAVRG